MHNLKESNSFPLRIYCIKFLEFGLRNEALIIGSPLGKMKHRLLIASTTGLRFYLTSPYSQTAHPPGGRVMSLFVSLDQNTFPDLMEMAFANITGGIGTFGDLPVRA